MKVKPTIPVGISLGLTVVLTLITVFVDKITDKIEGSTEVELWILVLLVGLVVSLLILVLLLYLERQYSSGDVVPTEKVTTKKGLKDIPSEMELEKIITENYITKIFVRRCFDPSQEPGVEGFLRGLEIHRPYCKCGNTFMFASRREVKVYYCNNKDGHKTVPFKYGFIEIEKELIEILNTFKGEVRRSEYKKYWKMYTDWYNELTNGNYDEYYRIYSYPVNQIVFD